MELMGDNDGGKEIIELVDSLFSVCALFNHIQTFSALERKQKPKRNSKRSIKQRCRLGGVEATAAAAAPPGLSQTLRWPPNDVEGVLWGVFW
jgi:hypothetical protein